MEILMLPQRPGVAFFFLAITSLFLTTFAMAQSAPAADKPATTTASTQPAGMKLRTDRLVIFKDGHGLVIKSGSGVADADGRAFITDVPDAAILGCFWATSGDDQKILALRAE